jgi:hypothetical protein
MKTNHDYPQHKCLTCGGSDFWRWPKNHPQHGGGWLCWYCASPPKGTELIDIYSAPDGMVLLWQGPHNHGPDHRTGTRAQAPTARTTPSRGRGS